MKLEKMKRPVLALFALLSLAAMLAFGLALAVMADEEDDG